MAGVKGAKLAARSGIDIPRKHYCPDHDAECKPTMVWPGRKMKYNCPQGCELGRRETLLK